ncbi:MAG: MFS transporter [Alphaproteobacteria bacterium]|nr:MFS transporter [Alphaproteobacteria bacterium]
MAAATVSVRRDVRILGIIGSGHFLSHFYVLCLPPLFPFFKSEFGVSYAALGLLLSIRSIANGTMQVPVGFLVDRVGARAVLTTGITMMAVGIALISFVQSYWALVALVVVIGVGSSTFHPADYSLLNASIAGSKIGRAFSLHTFSGQLGTATAPVIIIFLATLFDWRTALVLVGLVGIAVMGVLATQWNRIQEDGATSRKKKTASSMPSLGPETLRGNIGILLSKPMLIFLAFYSMTSLASGGLQAFTVVALVSLHDTPLAAASGALTGYLFASALGVLLGGVIADRTTRHDIQAALAFIAGALIMLVVGGVSLHFTVIVFALTLAGLTQGMIRPARDMMVRAAVPKGAIGRAFGFVSAGASVGGALSPVLFGWVIDLGKPEWVFYLLAIIMVLSIGTAMVPKGTVNRD